MLEFRCHHNFSPGFRLEVEFRAEAKVTALFGPSGAGKTSVLSIIAGLTHPREGFVGWRDRVLFDSRSGACLPPEARGLGCVFQELLLFPHCTVRGNLRYGLKRRGRAGPVPWDRVVEVLELGPLLDRYPRTLSGGERQRVALGRALLRQPDLLLLDEPWSALDTPLRDRILDYLERALAAWDLPAIIVSHDQAAVRRLASQVVVLDGGRVIAVGSPDEALGQETPLRWKDASRPVNVLRLKEPRLQEGHWMGRVGDNWVHLPPSARPLTGVVHVEFLPGDVTLSRHDVAGLSVRNRLRGRVHRLVPLAEGVFVSVDVGELIWSEVTPEAVAELQLSPGVEVTCLIKTHSLRLMG